MVILHIASIYNDPYSGVPNAVPTIVNSQVGLVKKLIEKKGNRQGFCQIGFLNVRNIDIDRIDVQVGHKRRIKDLTPPFDKPDIVVFHEVYYPAFIPLSLECRRRKIKYIVVPHGCLTKEALGIKSFKKRVGNAAAFGSYVMHAEALQFLSEKEKKNTIFRKKGFICPTGIVIPDFSYINMKKPVLDENTRESVSEKTVSDEMDSMTGSQKSDPGRIKIKSGLDKILGNKIVRFTYIGRIDPYIKGLDILIDAIVKNREYIIKNNCLFDLYGNIADEKGLSELVEQIHQNQLRDIVNIHPAVDEAEKRRILQNTDVFVLVSRSEALPTGVLEALSYGVPCMVSRGTGMADIIEETKAGWGEKRNTISDLLIRVVEDIKNGSGSVKSINARKLAEEKYDCKKAAGRAIAVYRKILHY